MQPHELFEDVKPVEMTNAEYHASGWDSISKTRLTTFAASPQKFYQRYITGELEDKDTPALAFGRVFHEVVLECQGLVDEESWQKDTLAVFRPYNAPSREPDVETETESIWVTTLPEPGIIRRAPVWGEIEDGRHWSVLPDTGEADKVGFCAFADMHTDGVVFRAIPPSVLSNGAKRGKAWTEWKAANAGVELYSPNEWGQVLSMRRALRQHGDVNRAIFQGGVAEQSYVGRCVQTGLEVRTRVDYYKPEDGKVIVTDLKTARTASPRLWTTDAVRGDLHVQAVIVSGMMQHVFPDKDIEFMFAVIEKEPVYRVESFEVEPELIELGVKRYSDLMSDFKHCCNSGIWQRKGYGERQVIHTPNWLMPAF